MTIHNIATADCQECHGTALVPHPSAGQTYGCTYCDGSGVRKIRGYGGYKTAAGASKALATGTGERCRECKGTGQCTYSAQLRCYECTDGKVITAALPGWHWADLPRQLRYSRGRGSVAEGYAHALTYRVQLQNREGTWNEAYLGLGSIVSATDYGRTWDTFVADVSAARVAIIDKVREMIGKGEQWVKFTTSDDTLAGEIMISVHRSGYTVTAIDAAPSHVVLPPAYTPEALNRPVL